MATRDEQHRQRESDDPRDSMSRGEPAPDNQDPGARDAGDDRGAEPAHSEEDPAPVSRDRTVNAGDEGDTTVVASDDGAVTIESGSSTVEGGSGNWITTDGGHHEADGDASEPDDVDEVDDGEGEGDDPAGLDLASATMPGGPQDHLGMQVEQDHIPDIEGYRALADGGVLAGPAAGNLPGVADLGNLGYDPGSVQASPRDDERTIDDAANPFGRTPDPFAGFDQVAGRPGSLYENPAVVGADREAEALAAADPDLTGLVDMEGIAGGQVGGTIDGRTPDGGLGGTTSGFSATSGYDPGNLLEGATSQGLTNPHGAAAAVQQGVEEFGHGGFVVYDLHTGAAVYGPGVSAGNGPSIPAGSGPAGQYVIVQNGATFDGGQVTSSSSSPLSNPVKTGGSEGVVNQGGESVHANDPWFKKVADWLVQGSPTSPKAEALQQAEQTIQETSGPPPEAPERPDEGPETELPADPDAGGPPPPGLDLSREWAITVWARDNAEVNPNPMGEGVVAGSAQATDISEIVEQYEEAPLAPPSIDPDARLGPDISEQFTEFDG